ncbi:MAG: HAD hydrolase-like protein, partial [Gammaproteobacteria bacterium]|nr:HAD hydrolase-like protein [Gammaproteobacteria bacterium]
HALYAFSNGTAVTVNGLLERAGVRELLVDVISVEALATFKPDPGVYAHFCAAAAVSPGQAWLVSGNPFDAIGAMNAGMKSAWVRRRTDARFDPWGMPPTVTCGGLGSLLASIEASSAPSRSAD